MKTRLKRENLLDNKMLYKGAQFVREHYGMGATLLLTVMDISGL
jgi:hypothetical protein